VQFNRRLCGCFIALHNMCAEFAHEHEYSPT
jgi:hypothetical protein